MKKLKDIRFETLDRRLLDLRKHLTSYISYLTISFLISISLASQICFAQTISTIIGKPEVVTQLNMSKQLTPTSAEIGDGGKAASANIIEPSNIVIDPSGNIYFVDGGHYRVRKISTDATISTIAGNGKRGKGKDKIAAIKDAFEPAGLAMDAKGNIYVSDASANKVRKIDAAGMITTIAGTNKAGFSGDDGLAIKAQLNNPYNVAVDGAGNVYFTDNGNARIRKINPEGIITTVAGNGDMGSNGDGGAATAAEIDSPNGLAIDREGNIYFTESYFNRVRKINTNGIISTYAGNGTAGFLGDGGAATKAALSSPQGIALDAAGNLYVAERDNAIVRKINTAGIISTVAGSGVKGYDGDGTNATFAKLNHPAAVAVDANGNLYITDSGSNSIRKVSAK